MFHDDLAPNIIHHGNISQIHGIHHQYKKFIPNQAWDRTYWSPVYIGYRIFNPGLKFQSRDFGIDKF